jgi:hypothetical protein
MKKSEISPDLNLLWLYWVRSLIWFHLSFRIKMSFLNELSWPSFKLLRFFQKALWFPFAILFLIELLSLKPLSTLSAFIKNTNRIISYFHLTENSLILLSCFLSLHQTKIKFFLMKWGNFNQWFDVKIWSSIQSNSFGVWQKSVKGLINWKTLILLKFMTFKRSNHFY